MRIPYLDVGDLGDVGDPEELQDCRNGIAGECLYSVVAALSEDPLSDFDRFMLLDSNELCVIPRVIT
jgi:hypothetical protein